MPVNYLGGKGLFERPEVTVLQAALSCLVVPHDEQAAHTLAVDLFHIPATALVPLIEWAHASNRALLPALLAAAKGEAPPGTY